MTIMNKELDKKFDDMIMEALKLSKAHTNWKTGKGSVKSFGVAKTRFYEKLIEYTNSVVFHTIIPEEKET